jgi:hypothetical protein
MTQAVAQILGDFAALAAASFRALDEEENTPRVHASEY